MSAYFRMSSLDSRRTRLNYRLVAGLLAVLAVVAATLVAGSGSASAAYPGADGRIALVRANQIYTINPDGSGLALLTTRAQNYRPRFSPDGSKIAFIHRTASGSSDVWLMRADGQNKRRVTHVGTVTAAPAWSPDGEFIAFASQVRFRQALQKVHGSRPFGAPQLIRGHEAGDSHFHAIDVEAGGALAWSPDGNHIMISTDEFPESPDHFIVDLNLTNHVFNEWDLVGGACCGEGFFGDLAWNSSGSVIAYFKSNRHRIVSYTYPAGEVSPLVSARGDRQLAFSPSGDFVAFANFASGTPRVVLTDADGSARQVVIQGQQPDWQPVP